MCRKYGKLFDKAKGIKLDVGCGAVKQKGFVGMDIVPGENVDIVHEVHKLPWPVPSNICSMVLMSHVFEHIEPKYRFDVMDECWRIMRHDGQLWIAHPYPGSFLERAHPAHYPCPNEAAYEFFDPDYPLYHCVGYVKPKPWKIVKRAWEMNGCMEIVLEPRKDERGKALVVPKEPVKSGSIPIKARKAPKDEENENVLMPKRKEKKKC